MNTRLKQRSPARLWVAGITMLFLVLSGAGIVRALPAHASSNDVAPATHRSWKIVSSPNVAASDNGFNGIAAVSANDIWAVGSYITSGSPNQTLIEHWDGSAWSIVASPNVASSYNFLDGVAAISTIDVWAVGYAQNSSTFFTQTLIEHWDGSAWTIVPSPNPGTNYNFLYNLAVVSANNIWAVGDYPNTKDKEQTLAEHWNGSAWSVVTSPNVGRGYNTFTSVAVASTNDVWAVGYYHNYTTRSDQTLTEHWNGSAWSIVSSPSTGLTFDRLNSVTVVSSANVWAVGNHDTSNSVLTHIEHWNGSAWSIVASPNVGTAYNDLNEVEAISASNIWAVGFHDAPGGAYSLTLVEHWNGSSWKVVASPSLDNSQSPLNGIAVVSASDIWAAGYYYNTGISHEQTLIENYS